MKTIFGVFSFLLLLVTTLSAQGGSTPGTPAPSRSEGGPPSEEKEFERQYQERIKKDRLYGIYIPKNLDDALLQLDKLLSPQKQTELMMMPEDSVCKQLHLTLGKRIIENWGFYGGSRLSHYLRSAGVTYPDDMGDFIMLAYHRKLNGKPVVLKDLVIHFRKFRAKENEARKRRGKVIKEEKKNKD
jgi:hypothetical protein